MGLKPQSLESSGDDDIIDPDVVPSEPAVSPDPEEPAVVLDPEEPAVVLDPEEPAVAQDDVQESEESGVSERSLQESSGDDDIINPDFVPSEPAVTLDPEEPRTKSQRSLGSLTSAMTKPKVSGQCPICLKVLQHTSKHIREVHRIKNARERSILNAISTGRVDIGKGTCPVPGCGLFWRRLSKHIEAHSDLLPGRREAYQQVAHRDAALKRLSELWATDPQPPMASVLDLEDSLASECRNPSCIQREFRIRELETFCPSSSSVPESAARSRSSCDVGGEPAGVWSASGECDIRCDGPGEFVVDSGGDIRAVRDFGAGDRDTTAYYTMTKPKQSGQCPICLKVLMHISKHIREVHRIRNQTERSILNGISSGRIYMQQGLCPVPGCGVFRRRLSTHLEGHVDLLPGRRESFKQVAHRDAALKQLSELRATNPQPPMASVLDLEDSLASECRLPSCIQREFRIRELEHAKTNGAGSANPHPVEAAPPKNRSTRFLFLGYLSAYLACIYGHRTEVFTKMTQAEVLEHKTVQTYGHAQVYLTAEEYGWCRRWLGLLRRTIPSSIYFFCSFGEGPIKDLRGYMGRAWTDMGLGPVPTFMDIRTAVAT
uniref:C2H2-type domain-containing protein n=1 Tax=Knipowitschia caucasica TaxID=637954 RepID=A0AAV2LI07_KNICA